MFDHRFYVFVSWFFIVRLVEAWFSAGTGSFQASRTSPSPLTVLHVAIDPPMSSVPESLGRNDRYPRRRKTQAKVLRKKPAGKPQTDAKLAEFIEHQVGLALDSMRLNLKPNSNGALNLLLFPTIRECNRALATFGDEGDLLRALRLFGKMRKAASLQASLPGTSGTLFPVPAPTLVTYSTLMSRAVKLSKPLVALRLWKLMQSVNIEPDIRAVNILMNCYAKLADLKGAESLMNQIQTGCGPDITSPLEANLVTYNTLLDACHKAGDLDAALLAKADLEIQGIRPDARTYTTLIATVARKKSTTAGQNDPSLAFALLQEMKDRRIKPNGMTYCAVIDAASRCQRSDLALQGLRMVIRQKESDPGLDSVGAWTAAINACGKVGRLDTAIRLFYAMPNFGVEPNTVTCGCLTDSLLKAGRTAETLEVLKLMKDKDIAPSEVMYTSLMTRAERLVQIESKKDYKTSIKINDSRDTKAIQVYTQLMESLTDGRKRESKQQRVDPNTHLLKVFLVFQEMKAAGATPDLACFNALLRACMRCGDVERAQDVLRQLQLAGLEPNDTSWRHLILAAARARNSEKALTIWKQGLEYRRSRVKADEPVVLWNPSTESLTALMTAYLYEAVVAREEKKTVFYQGIVDLYNGLLLGDERLGLNRMDPNEVLDNTRTMLVVLQALVSLERLLGDKEERIQARRTAESILELECFQDFESGGSHLNSAASRALQKARSWRLEKR